MRANIDNALYFLPHSPSSGQYLNEKEELKSYPVNNVIALSHVFSPALINETKFGFNRGTTDTIYLNPTGSLYAISVGASLPEQRSCQHRRRQYVCRNRRSDLGQGEKCHQGRSRGPPRANEPGGQFLWHGQL